MEEDYTPIPERAWQDTWRWLLNTKWGWVIAILVGGVMSGIFVGDTILSRALSGLIGAIIAIIVILGITYIVHLIITPISHRNKAWDKLKTESYNLEVIAEELRKFMVIIRGNTIDGVTILSSLQEYFAVPIPENPLNAVFSKQFSDGTSGK